MKDELIYGLHAVEVLLDKRPESVKAVLCQSSRQDERLKKIINKAKAKKIPIEGHDKKSLDKMMADAKHQGVAARVKPVKLLQSENDLIPFIESLAEPAFILILDGVQDPHNFGACLRSADAAGVDAVVIPKDRAVGVTPAVRKVACGAAESVPVFQITNLSRTMTKLKEQGLWIVGSAGESEDLVYDIDLKGPIAIVAGSEGEGMRQLTKKNCDFLVKIPMHGIVSSLNVSVATAVLLYEVVRQRR